MMYRQNNLNGFNPEVVKDLSKIYNDIKEETQKENPDKKRLLELETLQLYRGMELNTGLGYNNYRRNIPW